MKTSRKGYYIYNPEFPIKFQTEDYDMTDYIEEAAIYNSYEKADLVIKEFGSKSLRVGEVSILIEI